MSSSSSKSNGLGPDNINMNDPGAMLLKGLVTELLRRLGDPQIAKDMTAAEMNLVRQLCADNSVSFASIKRGDFGMVAKEVAESFPFPEGPSVGLQ